MLAKLSRRESCKNVCKKVIGSSKKLYLPILAYPVLT